MFATYAMEVSVVYQRRDLGLTRKMKRPRARVRCPNGFEGGKSLHN